MNESEVQNESQKNNEAKKSNKAATEELVEFELEENIYSYLLFLLTMNEKSFKKLVPRFQVQQVLFVIVLTLALQVFALTIMVQDILTNNYFYTDVRKYQFLRYALLIFSSVLFLQEIGSATTEFRLSCFSRVVKRERLPYFFRFFQFTLLLKLLLCYYTLGIVIMIILFTHLAREQGIGIILNFTAAMIVIDFDDITSKLFVTLNNRNMFKNFLQLQVGKKILK